MSKKKKLIPELRFPEFSKEEEWEEKPLAELADRVTLKNKDGRITNVFTNSAAYGIVDQRTYFDKDIANKKNLENYYVVEDGDYVYNPRISSEAPVGPISKNKMGCTGVMSPLYTVFRFLDERNQFFEYYFTTNHWFSSIRKASNTGARFDRMSIADSAFMDIPVFSPSPEEQQKIADCLSSLDELINTHNDKLEALKNHKKGLMQDLFPLEGKSLPKLRFSRDANWIDASLPDVVFFQEGPGIMKVDFRNEGVPLVRLAGISGPTVTLEGCNFLDPVKVKSKWSHFQLSLNDLLISTSATFGLSSIVTEAAVGAVFYTGLIRFRPVDDKLDRDYLKVFLESPPFERQVKLAAVGGGIKHFGPTHLKQMKIFLPPLAEQQKIASCLNSVNELISSQTERIKQLQQHKTGLIQGLFPKSES